MKKFIVKSIVISLPILVVFMFLEILLRHIPNDYSFKKQYLDKNSSQIENLILGSSHSFYGLNPEYFHSNTFNASHISQSLNYDFEILNKYKKKFNNLKTIILPISYFTLFSNIEAGPESWRVKNYILYYDIGKVYTLKYRSEILSNDLNKNFERLKSYYLLNKQAKTSSKLGWGTKYSSINARDLNETGRIASKRHTKNIDSKKNQKIYKENIFILKSIIEWSKSNNIKVLLFTPPAYKSYRINLNSDQVNKFMQSTAEICLNSTNCAYINLLSDKRFNANDYFDADHLSDLGAKKLSEIINSKIEMWK